MTSIDRRTGDKHDSRYVEPKIFCKKGNVPQQTKKPTLCNWYAEDERVVKNCGDYVILSRQEHVREILIVPITHKTNRESVVDVSFWRFIVDNVVNQFLKKFHLSYPVECYAINFGRWESETAKDKNALECHAHFHIHLDKNVVLGMEQKKDNNGEYYYRAMHGKINDPVHYGMKNCKKLETSRLSSLEMIDVRKDVSGLVDKVNGLDAKVNGLDKNVTNLRNDVSELDKKMSTFMQQIVNELSKLKNASTNSNIV